MIPKHWRNNFDPDVEVGRRRSRRRSNERKKSKTNPGCEVLSSWRVRGWSRSRIDLQTFPAGTWIETRTKTSSCEGVCSPENSSNETRSVQRSIQNITKFEGVDQDPPSFPRRPDLAKSSIQSVTLEFKSRGFPLGLNIDCIAFN